MCCNCKAVSTCCGTTLKNGVLATSIYSLVISLFYVSVDIYRITRLEMLIAESGYSLTYLRNVYITGTCIYGAWLLFTIGLLVASRTGKRCLMMAWVVYTWILTVLIILAELVLSITYIKEVFANPLSGAIYIILIITVIINIYCCLVVNSYYHSLAPVTQTTIVTANPGNVQVVQTSNTQGYVYAYDQQPIQFSPMKSMPPRQGYDLPPQYAEYNQ